MVVIFSSSEMAVRMRSWAHRWFSRMENTALGRWAYCSFPILERETNPVSGLEPPLLHPEEDLPDALIDL